MLDLEHPWLRTKDREERGELAIRFLHEHAELVNSPGWELLQRYIEANLFAATESLIAGGASDSEMRGAIKALRHIRSMPNRQIKAAQDELKSQG